MVPCCPKCGSHSFTFAPIHGPITFVTAAATAREQLETWIQSSLKEFELWKQQKIRQRDEWYATETRKIQEWMVSKLQELKRSFQATSAAIEQTYKKEMAKIKDSFLTLEGEVVNNSDDPYYVLYDNPKEARDNAIITAESKRKQSRESLAGETQSEKEQIKATVTKKQAAIDDGINQARVHIDQEILQQQAALEDVIEKRRKQVEDFFQSGAQYTLLLVFCQSCGHPVGTTTPPDTQLMEAIRDVSEAIKMLHGSIKSAAVAADQENKAKAIQGAVDLFTR